ncbi:MAG TPA: phosphoribosylamine--glycine ligase [Candidatus Woesearchaeota archaeon]|nr:MAG: phosphoribosylamine--glycine ligase [Candidatus Woesearchaeota archaeon]HDD70672.1 phosphoribosylamine--glycine ligase [Candidatus Woesearchaeota archaeon]
MGEKILVIGSGGREHAFAKKLAESDHVSKVYCAPGNAGTEMLEKGENVKLNTASFQEIINFARDKEITLTVVGPEKPLVDGIVDAYEKSLPSSYIFGPNKVAAELEGSKSFAKGIMTQFNIPTAEYEAFDDPRKAKAYIERQWGTKALVVKADGLAAGKGVIVPENLEEAVNAVQKIMVKKAFGEAGNKIVIEEKLTGEEASVLALSDGKTIKQLISIQDHKPVYDGDKGPNTGGMGAYGPAPVILGLEEEIYETILSPLVNGLRKIGMTYKGIIYAGLMITEEGPKVLEFNVRGGDPEMQPIAMLTDFDWYEACMACITGKLHEIEIKHKDGAACCVVMASKGYPGSYEKGKEITGLEKIIDPDVFVFHAGTKKEGDGLVTNGGRVLGVTAYGKDIRIAQEKAYNAVRQIKFADDYQYFRTDIADKAIRRLNN